MSEPVRQASSLQRQASSVSRNPAPSSSSSSSHQGKNNVHQSVELDEDVLQKLQARLQKRVAPEPVLTRTKNMRFRVRFTTLILDKVYMPPKPADDEADPEELKKRHAILDVVFAPGAERRQTKPLPMNDYSPNSRYQFPLDWDFEFETDVPRRLTKKIISIRLFTRGRRLIGECPLSMAVLAGGPRDIELSLHRDIGEERLDIEDTPEAWRLDASPGSHSIFIDRPIDEKRAGKRRLFAGSLLLRIEMEQIVTPTLILGSMNFGEIQHVPFVIPMDNAAPSVYLAKVSTEKFRVQFRWGPQGNPTDDAIATTVAKDSDGTDHFQFSNIKVQLPETTISELRTFKLMAYLQYETMLSWKSFGWVEVGRLFCFPSDFT